MIFMLMTVIDCGVPIGDTVIVIDHESFNDTKLDTVVTFHCKDSNLRQMAVCGSNGEWIPNLTSLQCENGTAGNISWQHFMAAVEFPDY